MGDMRHNTTVALLWLVTQLNRHKDRDLARRLADMARDYDPKDGTAQAIVVDGATLQSDG